MGRTIGKEDLADNLSIPPCIRALEVTWGNGSVKEKPFYCESSFQGRVFVLLAFCKQNASVEQLLSHMETVYIYRERRCRNRWQERERRYIQIYIYSLASPD